MVSLNDVLLAYSNIPVDDPIAEIWGRGLQGGYEIIEYTGTLPITIVTDGTALINYCIYGNTVQDGTPTPEAPVDVVGCGVRTENLYNINAKDINNGYINNAQLEQDGTVTIWGGAEVSEYIPISGDTTYTFNGIGSYNSPCYALYDENKQLIGAYRYNGARIIQFTSPSDARYFRFTHIKTASMAMLVEGSYTLSTMPEYEPYGYKLPILSNSTVTNIYLGEVQTTRRIKKLVLTGEENCYRYIYANSNGIEVSNVLDANHTRDDGFCSHYPVYPKRISGNSALWIGVNSKSLYFVGILDMLGMTSVSDFKSYLAAQYAAGTPVTVWYVLAEPETGIVNEPLMKIGDYVDTLSMEQADVSIPTFAGTTVIDYDRTPKPSEMYIKYRR